MLLKTVAGVAVMIALAGNGGWSEDAAAIRARLADARPLAPDDIRRTLATVRDVLADKTFRLTLGLGTGPEFVIDGNGHVRFSRAATNNVVTFSQYTGRPAVHCDGTPAPAGELVVEFRQAGARWSVTARSSTPREVGKPVFDMIAGDIELRDGGIAKDGRARLLTAPWSPRPGRTEGAMPGGGTIAWSAIGPGLSGTQTLYVDIGSLRPLRWEVRVDANTVPPSAPLAYVFEHDGLPVLEPPPTDAALPNCM